MLRTVRMLTNIIKEKVSSFQVSSLNHSADLDEFWTEQRDGTLETVKRLRRKAS